MRIPNRLRRLLPQSRNAPEPRLPGVPWCPAGANATEPWHIEISRSAMDGIRQTIGRHPPETVGLLGGYLDEPFWVTDFRFCPPARNRQGRYDRSLTHINVDHDYMNFVVDEEWRPNGKYMLGLVHSHPPGCVSPTYGDLLSNEGDMVFLQSCLRHDDSPGRNWRYCLAPIITFSAGGAMIMHGWVVTLDNAQPFKAAVAEIDDGGRGNAPAAVHGWSDAFQDSPQSAPSSEYPEGTRDHTMWPEAMRGECDGAIPSRNEPPGVGTPVSMPRGVHQIDH